MNQAHAESVQRGQYSRIGGWLIVVAVALVLSAVSVLFFITSEILPAFRAIPFIEVSSWLRFYLISNLVLNVLLFLYVIVVGVMFFQRRKIVPKLIISLYVLNLLFVVLDRFIFMTASEDQWTFSIISGVVSALIWIPYFVVSKRARATFVV